MFAAKMSETRCAQYELEISIQAPRERVWKAIVTETNAWWLAEFRMVGAGSHVTFDARAGGGLLEQIDGEGSLLWYTVHCIRPELFTVYLAGQVAPDWGGPATSHLKLAVEEQADGGCLLKVFDALQGNVDEAGVKSLYDGWTQLFHDGLKPFVERE